MADSKNYGNITWPCVLFTLSTSNLKQHISLICKIYIVDTVCSNISRTYFSDKLTWANSADLDQAAPRLYCCVLCEANTWVQFFKALLVTEIVNLFQLLA